MSSDAFRFSSLLQRRKRLPLSLAVLVAAGLAAMPTVPLPAQQVEDLTQQSDVQIKRRVRDSEDRLRLLFTRGDYQDVITEADALLEISPNNAPAILLKDMAERRLATGERPDQPRPLRMNPALAPGNRTGESAPSSGAPSSGAPQQQQQPQQQPLQQAAAQNTPATGLAPGATIEDPFAVPGESAPGEEAPSPFEASGDRIASPFEAPGATTPPDNQMAMATGGRTAPGQASPGQSAPAQPDAPAQPAGASAANQAPAQPQQANQAPAAPVTMTRTPAGGATILGFGRTQFLAIVGGALLLLAAVIVAFILFFRRRNAQEEAFASAMAGTTARRMDAATRDDPTGMANMPTVDGDDETGYTDPGTGFYDERTNVEEKTRSGDTSVYDEPTLSSDDEDDKTEVGADENTGFSDAPTGMADPKTGLRLDADDEKHKERDTAPGLKKQDQSPAGGGEDEHLSGLRLDDVYSMEAQEQDSSLGIDYGSADEESGYTAASSQAPDIHQTAQDPFYRAPEEKVAPKPPGDSEAETMMGRGVGEDTAGLDISQPAPPVEPAASEFSDVDSNSETLDITKPLSPEGSKPSEPATAPAGEAETKGIDISAAAGSAPPEGSGEAGDVDMSFSSLMFGADQDETKLPGAEQEGSPLAPAPQPEPEKPAAAEQFDGQESDMSFNSLMFGAEQTAAPGLGGGEAPGASGLEADPEATAPLPPARKAADASASSDPDATVGLPGASSGDAAADDEGQDTAFLTPHPTQKIEKEDQEKTAILQSGVAGAAAGSASQGKGPSLFDKQKSAGVEAMEAGDYARAVQCLSVASSMKPGDQEVRQLLEEAREKRRTG